MKFRSVFISDVHLGTPGCKADALVEFLDQVEFSYLFIVGDFIDFWRMQAKGAHWPHSHSKVIRKLIKLSKKVDIIYVPGNHDELFRHIGEVNIGFIEIREQAVHYLAGRQKVLVMHGDRFDHIICHQKWLAKVGSRAYEYLIRLNILYNRARSLFGLRYWSLAQYLKLKSKKALRVIDNFEEAVTTYAQSEGFDQVVCGHIHNPEVKEKNGVVYANCGDWVENCSAVVETAEGDLRVLRLDSSGDAEYAWTL